jgi:hypothetical protein
MADRIQRGSSPWHRSPAGVPHDIRETSGRHPRAAGPSATPAALAGLPPRLRQLEATSGLPAGSAEGLIMRRGEALVVRLKLSPEELVRLMQAKPQPVRPLYAPPYAPYGTTPRAPSPRPTSPRPSSPSSSSLAFSPPPRPPAPFQGLSGYPPPPLAPAPLRPSSSVVRSGTPPPSGYQQPSALAAWQAGTMVSAALADIGGPPTTTGVRLAPVLPEHTASALRQQRRAALARVRMQKERLAREMTGNPNARATDYDRMQKERLARERTGNPNATAADYDRMQREKRAREMTGDSNATAADYDRMQREARAARSDR